MALRDCGGEGKTQSRSRTSFPALCIRSTLETFENPRTVGLGYTRAIIRHDENRSIVKRHANGPSGRHVFEGIV